MVKYLPDERKIFIYMVTKGRERLLQQVGFLRMMQRALFLIFIGILGKMLASGRELSFSKSYS